MDSGLVARLLELNRTFYRHFAKEFAATRSGPWPGFTRLLPHLHRTASILDIGCGNGRLARFLEDRRQCVSYCGIDSCRELVGVAREILADSAHAAVELCVLDVTRDDWTRPLVTRRFDAVLALAVLQHLPSFALRSSVLQSAAGLLTSDGALVMCNWQLSDSEWLARRQVAWKSIGVDQAQLECGDYLLDWRRGGLGYRYCHRVDEDEAHALASGAGLWVADAYYADGPSGDLNHYVVMRGLGV